MMRWIQRVFSVRDTRDRESTTLGFVTIAFFAVVVKFVLAGIGPIPEMSGVDFGVAVGSILGIWVAREWSDKKAAAEAKAAEITASAKVEAASVVADAKVEEAEVRAKAQEGQ